MKQPVAKITGSGIGRWASGEQILAVESLRVGEVLTNFSKQFSTLNLVKVTRVAEDFSRLYGVFADPNDPNKKRLDDDEEFCIWGFEINRSLVLHRAIPRQRERRVPGERLGPPAGRRKTDVPQP